MQNKLEEIKMLGSYSIQVYFGEDVGCDDMDVKPLERSVKVVFYPVGCLGECRILYKGSLNSFLKFDFKTKPVKVSNPPKSADIEADGYYIWGTERSVDNILEKPFFGKWK